LTTRLVAAVALGVVLLCGCGGGDDDGDAARVLRDTAAKVAQIRSAELDLRMSIAPHDGGQSGRVGFALRGPVDLRSGGLPVARLEYTQIAGSSEGAATFTSDGRRAFVEVGGTAYRLPRAQVDELAQSAGSVRGGARLPVGRWIRDPNLEQGEDIGGAPTDHVSGKLDAPAALRDIFGAARSAGAPAPDLSGAKADDLRKAIESASVDVWSGRDDRLLRRVRIALSFRVSPPAGLKQRLGSAAGGRFAFELTLARPNEPVRVQAPAHARPASALR
jgi:hypothetical protein